MTEEVEGRPDVTVVIRCMPLLENRQGDRRPGADARRLRPAPPGPAAAVQGRRHPRGPPPGQEQPADDLVAAAPPGPPAAAGEGKSALEEAERRVRTIALVHEILSRDASDQVDFNDIVPSLVRMAEDLLAPEAHFRIGHDGEAGELPADGGHAAGGDPHRAAAERGRARLSRGPGEPRARCRPVMSRCGSTCRSSATTASCWSQVRDNGRACREGSPSRRRPAWACRSCGTWSGPSWAGRIEMRTDGGTVVDVIVPTTAQADDDESLPADLRNRSALGRQRGRDPEDRKPVAE